MTDKKKIILHIGHGKTGTSATQHLLAKNAGVLKSHGILYPEGAQSMRAVEGKITSGNVSPVLKENWFDTEILDRVDNERGFHTFVFSSEHMFWALKKVFPRIAEAKSQYDISVIMAVREPLEMLSSAYGQAVKNSGVSKEISEYEPAETHIVLAAKHLQTIEQIGLPVDVLNYSALKYGISEAIFELIGMDPTKIDDWNIGSAKIINRSLTQAEIRLMIGLNKHFTADIGRRCADALAENLPDIAAEAIDIPRDVFERFAARVRPAVTTVNEALPDGQKLQMHPPRVTDDAAALTAEQADVFFKQLSVAMAVNTRSSAPDGLENRIAKLTAERDHAIRYPWKYIRSAIRQRLG